MTKNKMNAKGLDKSPKQKSAKTGGRQNQQNRQNKPSQPRQQSQGGQNNAQGTAKRKKKRRYYKKKKRVTIPDYIPREVLDALPLRYPDLREQILDYVRSEDYQPQRARELAASLGWNHNREEMTVFLQMIRKLELDYEIVMKHEQRYLPPEAAGIYRGVFLGTARGFGFVQVDDPDMPDIYIHPKRAERVMHRDEVIVRIFGHLSRIREAKGFRPEGEILKVTKRANEQIIGVFDLVGRNAQVYPDEKRLNFAVNIPFNDTQGAQPGDKVIVEITLWGGGNQSPMGRVTNVLGNENAKGVDMLSVLWQHHLPEDFPAPVLRAADKAASPITKADFENRRDMREQPLVTIDGIDSKDLDDAVSCRELPNGNIELSVHIADVAHYVRQDSTLDKEAFARGTSVYLPDRVIPMLPRALSNGICSLNAGVDRLAMSCTMEINKIGNVENYDIYESVIRVDKRLDYDTVNLMLIDEDEKAIAENREWLPMLKTMAVLQQRLAKKRRRRGAINFNMPETKVIVDPETGKTLDVVKREQRLAEGLIEQAMVAANETVATHFHRLKMPFIYRVHQSPAEEKLNNLNTSLLPLGLCVEPSKTGVKPKDFQKMLRQAEGIPQEKFVQMMSLRSMRHAEYLPEALGHFGLASRYYSHFTSPIRRYADLSIHRVIKACLAGKLTAAKRRDMAKRLAKDAEQATRTEQLAENAERDAVDLKCCQFMQDKLGEIFVGHVSGVSAQGVWVELPNTIEGRVAVADLPFDDYDFIWEEMTLKGGRRSYRLGDEMKVMVARVDLAAREIDFVLAD